MKRKLAGLMAVVMAFAILAFGSTALAETWTSKETFTIKKGKTENIRIPGAYGTVNWAKVDPAGVVRIESASEAGIDIEAIRPGSTTMTISSMTVEEGITKWHTGTMTITVTDADGNLLGTGLGVHDLNKTANYRVEVGKTITPVTHNSITGTPTVSQSGILTATVQNVVTGTDAQVAAITGITSAGAKSLQLTGVSPGTVTVSYYYQDQGDTTDQKANILVDVVPAGSLSDATAKTQNVSLTKGSTSNLASNYYEIKSVQSSSESIVQASITGSAGSMNLELKALKAGTSNITFTYKPDSAGDVLKQSTMVVTVREGAGVSSLADEDSGIYLTPRKSSAKVGKTYRANAKLNGKEMDKDAEAWNEFVWISTNTSVATIEADTGWFTIVGKGTTKIVCISKDGSMMDTVTVTGK